VNLIFATEGPKSTDFAEGMIRPLPAFAQKLRGALGDVLRAVPDAWTYWPMGEVTTPRWFAGPIGLIGDAAHAMLPFQAQGAAMAIEDAAVLAPLLIGADRAEAALTTFEQLRRPRVERVQKLSRFNGTAYHMGWPATLARDASVRLMGPLGQMQRLAWLWSYEATETPVLQA
jgi:salicylate hydroxylase